MIFLLILCSSVVSIFASSREKVEKVRAKKGAYSTILNLLEESGSKYQPAVERSNYGVLRRPAKVQPASSAGVQGKSPCPSDYADPYDRVPPRESPPYAEPYGSLIERVDGLTVPGLRRSRSAERVRLRSRKNIPAGSRSLPRPSRFRSSDGVPVLEAMLSGRVTEDDVSAFILTSVGKVVLKNSGNEFHVQD